MRQHGSFLALSVRDDGQGVDPRDVETVFFESGERTHALALLRRRLRGLFGRFCQIDVRSGCGEGTTITMRIPLQMSATAAASTVPVAIVPAPDVLLSR